MRQIGIRLHDTVKGTLEERIISAKEQGFKCVQLALPKAVSDNSTADAALTPGYAMHIKRLFAKHDMDIAVLGCYYNLANPNEESLKAVIEKYKAHIRFAALLGCGVVGTETGAPNEEYRFEAACHSEEALNIFIKNVKIVVDYAERMGVILAIEPVFTHIVSTPERARRVLDEVASPNLQIIFDPVNLLHISNHENRNQIFRDAIRLLGKDITVLHVKDYNVLDGKVVSGPVGTGIMDYREIVDFIEKEKPYMHCTLEDTKPDNAVAARTYFESL